MKKTTIVISDLHLGGGAADPGDDHVYQDGHLTRFLVELGSSAEGKSGDIELFINGDFLEFAQTNQQAYQSPSADYWCSESESASKLEVMLQGHASVFAALTSLMKRGNTVSIAGGNHDVDLYWPEVQRRLKSATHASLTFQLGREWFERYDGRLQIAHGHLQDPANTFMRWDHPFADAARTPARLEMCAGTLFMVKFVNALEERYPFADNLHPVQNLARLLFKEEKSGLAAISWALIKFAGRHPIVMGDKNDFGSVLLDRLHKEDALASALAAAANIDVPALRARLRTEIQLAEFLLKHWPEIDAAGIATQLDPRPANTMGGPSQSNTLGTIRSAGAFGKDTLRKIAKDRAAKVAAAEVVVMGHTHVPDDFPLPPKARYYNTGSWTRYVDLETHPNLTLKDLADETKFPYSLKFLHVQAGPDGKLAASLRTFAEQQTPYGS